MCCNKLIPKAFAAAAAPLHDGGNESAFVGSMLRITTQTQPTTITLVLEGKCRGPWVDELERCWRKMAEIAPGKKLRVNLGNVGFVDERGRELLGEMHAAGVQLVADGLMTASLVEEIVARRSSKQRA